MISRRQFIKTTAGAAGALAASGILLKPRQAYAAAVSPQLKKWFHPTTGALMPLRRLGPTGIPTVAGTPDPFFANTFLYQVTAGEFTDQLHPSLGPTKLWGYWDTNNPVKAHLGGVIIATRGIRSRIRFTNTLPANHIIPVDTTIPGANQAQNRIAVHLHGGYVPWISDGGPYDWWTPTGASGGSFRNGPGSILDNLVPPIDVGQADYFYPNDQSTRLMWYHDHAHGITRLNAYAGLATGYLCIDPAQEVKLANYVPSLSSTFPLIWQDKVFVNSTPALGVLTSATDPTWSLVARPDVQSTGSLWYEHVYNPKAFRQLKAKKFTPPPDPSAIPEFFGDTMLCNGTVYPVLEVQPKPYRFLMLNACNARFLNINTFVADLANPDGITLNPKTLFPMNAVGPVMWQIGTEGGYLAQEVQHVSPKPFNPALLTGNLLLGNAERADVIIDFKGFEGQDIILYNDAPGPFPAGPPTTDYFIGNKANPAMVGVLPGFGPDTRQILRIRVGLTVNSPIEPTPGVGMLKNAGIVMDPAPIAAVPTNPVAPLAPLTVPVTVPAIPVRDLTLNEDFDQWGRLRQLLGTTAPGILPGFGREYTEPATEVVPKGTTEVWRIFNLTADTHPIHFHIVNVQVMSRQPFKVVNGVFTPTGVARGPELNELGWKETVQMHPGEVTTIIQRFDLPGVPFDVPFSTRAMAAGGTIIPDGNEYVWHCHILEHEEHDMMRPLVVTGKNPIVTP
jgi:spore coat protein A, manganese oxidase